MPKQITDKTAARIVQAGDKLCDYIESGDTAVAAGVKVAKEFDLSANHIRLACRAYNSGVVNGDREEGNSFTAKFAVSSRVDPDDVIAKVFPTDVKQAMEVASPVASVYELASNFATDKTAKSKVIEIDRDLRVVRPKRKSKMQESVEKKDEESKYTKAKKKVVKLNDLRADLRRYELDAATKTAAVVDAYHSQFGSNTAPLLWVRKVAVDLFGKVAGQFIDPIADMHLGPVMRDKFAAEVDRGRVLGQQPIPITTESGVFKAVKDAMDAYKVWAKAEIEFPKQAIELRRAVAAELNRDAPFQQLLLPSETKESMEQLVWEKRSSMLMGMLAGSAARSGITGPPAGGLDANATLDAQVKLNDPAHQSELRRLSVEVMLNDLLNNDQVISSYNPDQIADAFEELGQSAPGVVDNPSLFRANMRRMLQGNLTAHDAESLVNQSQLGANPALPKPLSMLGGGGGSGRGSQSDGMQAR